MGKLKKYLVNIFLNMWKSEFNKNAIILVLGTTVAQAISILMIPILTKLYTPVDFGVLALFISIVSIISVIACGRYELAIILPEKDEDALNLVAVASSFNVFVSLIFLFFLFFYGDFFIQLIKAEILKEWIFLVPLMVFLNGVYNVLNYVNTRFRLYKDIAEARVYKSISMAVVQIVLGLLKFGYGGLILGHVIALVTANLKLFKNIYLQGPFKAVKKEKIKFLAKKYIKFPLLSTWSGLMNLLGYQFLNILIGIFFGSSTLGYFYLAYKVVIIPFNLIGSSIAQIFYQQSVIEKVNTGKSLNTFTTTLKKLVIISFIIFIPFFLLIKPILTILLGVKWKYIGMYAMILIPMVAVRFVSSVLSLTMLVYQKLQLEFFINFILAIVPLGLILLSNFLLKLSFIRFLILYSTVLSVFYFIFILIYFKLAIKESSKWDD